MLDSPTIRRARETDLARLTELYRQLHPQDPVLDDGRARVVFLRILETPWLQLFVLEVESLIRSTCYLNVIPNLTRAARPYAVIENVVTDQAVRRRGYGKQIVLHAVAFARSEGCYKVMLQTGSTREATNAFYRACGFSGDAKRAYVVRCEQ